MKFKLDRVLLWMLLVNALLSLVGTMVRVSFDGWPVDKLPFLIILLAGFKITTGFGLLSVFFISWFSYMALKVKSWAFKGLIVVIALQILNNLFQSIWIIISSKSLVSGIEIAVILLTAFMVILFQIFCICVFVRSLKMIHSPDYQAQHNPRLS